MLPTVIVSIPHGNTLFWFFCAETVWVKGLNPPLWVDRGLSSPSPYLGPWAPNPTEPAQAWGLLVDCLGRVEGWWCFIGYTPIFGRTKKAFIAKAKSHFSVLGIPGPPRAWRRERKFLPIINKFCDFNSWICFKIFHFFLFWEFCFGHLLVG